MKTIIIDNEHKAVELISQVFSEVETFNLIGDYPGSSDRVGEIIKQAPDVIFIEVELKVVNGIELAKKIKENCENVEIVLMSNKKEYAVQAFEIEAMDYVMKPLNKGRLDITLKRLQDLMEKHEYESQQLMVCSFQNLQFKCVNKNEYIDVKWRTKKTQELFAYLLFYQDKPVRKDLLIDAIWSYVDAEKGQTLLYSAIYQIRRTLKEMHSSIEILNSDNSYTLKLNQVKYDVREWELAMDQLPELNAVTLPEYIRVIKMYDGDYLHELDYLWAESERDILQSIWTYHIQKVVYYLEENESYMDMIRIYRYMIEVSPHNEDAYFELMKLANNMNNNEAVIQYYQKLESMLRAEFSTKPDIKIRNWYKYWLEKETLLSE